MIVVGDDLCDLVEATLSPCSEPDSCSVDVCVSRDVTIEPQSFETAPALEEFNMPNETTAHLTGRSSHMRQGIYMPGGYVDPGFTGELELEFFNMSNETVEIIEGEAAARLTFIKLSDTVTGYDGRWSN